MTRMLCPTANTARVWPFLPKVRSRCRYRAGRYPSVQRTAAQPGNGDQTLELLTERADHPVDLDIEALDIGRELIDVVQMHPQHQRVVGAETSLQRAPQLRDLRSHPGLRQLRQGLDITDADDQRFEHLPRRDPPDVGDH